MTVCAPPVVGAAFVTAEWPGCLASAAAMFEEPDRSRQPRHCPTAPNRRLARHCGAAPGGCWEYNVARDGHGLRGLTKTTPLSVSTLPSLEGSYAPCRCRNSMNVTVPVAAVSTGLVPVALNVSVAVSGMVTTCAGTTPRRRVHGGRIRVGDDREVHGLRRLRARHDRDRRRGQHVEGDPPGRHHQGDDEQPRDPDPHPAAAATARSVARRDDGQIGHPAAAHGTGRRGTPIAGGARSPWPPRPPPWRRPDRPRARPCPTGPDRARTSERVRPRSPPRPRRPRRAPRRLALSTRPSGPPRIPPRSRRPAARPRRRPRGRPVRRPRSPAAGNARAPRGPAGGS